MTRMFTFPRPDAAGEPVRDERLGALLRDVVGETPVTDVDWTALADRVGAAVRSHQAATWWSYVERWQRRALPLALAAGLAGALALWHSAAGGRGDAATLNGGADLLTAVIYGTPSAEAALSYAGALTSSMDLAMEEPE